MFNFMQTDKGLIIEKYTGGGKSVVIPKTYNGEMIVGIGEKAFVNNQYVETIDIQADLVIISAWAFEKCGNLISINLPETLVILGDRVFYDCKSLNSVKLPNKIDKISTEMFFGCYSLVEVELPDNIKTIQSGAFSHCSQLRKIKINEGVTIIEYNTFNYCCSLEEITLPKSLVNIYEGTFKNCYDLKKVVFLNEAITFDELVFDGCYYLEYITLSLINKLGAKQLYYILKDAIGNKNTISKDYYKELVASIRFKEELIKFLFTKDNQKITQILFDENVKLNLEEIDDCLEHSNKNNLTEITARLLDYKNKNFTDSEVNEYNTMKELVEIGLEYPTLQFFQKYWYYREVEGGIKIIGYKGYKTTVVIPKQLADGTKIIALDHPKKGDPNYVDPGNNYFIPYFIPMNKQRNKQPPIQPITKKEPWTGTIKKLIIGAGINFIEDYTFINCIDLEEINIPDTVTKIGKSAFQNCSKLTEIIISNSVTVLEERTFYACTRLTNIKMSENLIKIEDNAFNRCESLQKIILPDTLTEIGEHTFCDCKSLKEVIIPPLVTVIPVLAFNNCINLEVLKLHDNITLIKRGAFSECNSLENVILSKNTKIVFGSFPDSINIKYID